MTMSTLTLGWISWDPNPIFYVIPYIDWPIRWYGVFFAIGFALSYFVFHLLLQRLILSTPSLRESHIANWDHLIARLQEEQTKELLSYFSSSVGAWIGKHRKGGVIPPDMKTALVEGINSAMRNTHWTRSRINELFADALFKPKTISQRICDSLTWYLVLATIIGARLGHILFYQWRHYLDHPETIFKTWEGGLASHGGAIAIPIALMIFYRRYKSDLPEISLLRLFDALSVVIPLACFWIRIGNFVNQEIIGTPSSLPWAVIYQHPFEAAWGIPSHPVQIYEALAYLLTFFILLKTWLMQTQFSGSPRILEKSPKPGLCFGLMAVLVFSSRFFLEFFKLPQGGLPDSFPLQMGQILSIPCIFIGAFFLLRSIRSASTPHTGRLASSLR